MIRPMIRPMIKSMVNPDAGGGSTLLWRYDFAAAVDNYIALPRSTIDFKVDDIPLKWSTTDMLGGNGAIISQNISSSSSSREFQIYTFAGDARLYMIIAGGATTVIPGICISTDADYEVDIVGSTLTITRNGQLAHAGSITRGSVTEAAAELKVGARANGALNVVSFVYDRPLYNVELGADVNMVINDSYAANPVVASSGSLGNGTAINFIEGGWSEVESKVAPIFDIDTFIVFGASIMERSFTQGFDTDDAQAKFLAYGVTANVQERATSGNDSSTMVLALPAILSEFSSVSSTSMFIMHAGGNDISDSGPYPGGASNLDTNMRSMIADMKSAGFKVALSDVTYRIPPASHPSDPYNQNVMNPIISELADVRCDLYDLTINNQGTWYDPDGIHPSDPVGEEMTRASMVDSIGPFVAR